MIRKFNLSEITKQTYDGVCKRADIPESSNLFPYRRYFEILDDITHPNITEMIKNVKDDKQLLVSIWVPGLSLISEASRSTRYDLDNYIKRLSNLEDECKQIIIEFTKYLPEKDSNRKSPYYRDRFGFHKENELWRLKRFMVNKVNFSYYTFVDIYGRGMKLQECASISAVHDGP